MSKPEGYARISITLPVEVLHQADRLAEKLDRSRSWVVAEAIREYAGRALSPRTTASATDPDEGNLPSEAVTRSPISPDRVSALLADLALSVEDRVRASESAAAEQGDSSEEQLSVMAFRRAEEYSAWNRRRRAGR